MGKGHNCYYEEKQGLNNRNDGALTSNHSCPVHKFSKSSFNSRLEFIGNAKTDCSKPNQTSIVEECESKTRLTAVC